MFVALLGCENKQVEDFEEQGYFDTICDALKNVTTTNHYSVNSANDYSERDNGHSLKLVEIQIFYDKPDDINIQNVLDNFKGNIDLLILRKNYDLIKISLLIENPNDPNASEIFYEYLNYTNTFAEGYNVLSTKGLEALQ